MHGLSSSRRHHRDGPVLCFLPISVMGNNSCHRTSASSADLIELIDCRNLRPQFCIKRWNLRVTVIVFLRLPPPSDAHGRVGLGLIGSFAIKCDAVMG